MPTSDGISDADWGIVHQLAVEIANSADDEAAGAVLRERLLAYLAALEARYGTLPSILATRADYLAEDDVEGRLSLLIRAHLLASSQGDHRNAVYTASSLAAFYLDDLRDSIRGREWLITATELLSYVHDKSEAVELDRLATVLRRLQDG